MELKFPDTKELKKKISFINLLISSALLAFCSATIEQVTRVTRGETDIGSLSGVSDHTLRSGRIIDEYPIGYQI